MKPFLIIFLFLLFSCGKDSSKKQIPESGDQATVNVKIIRVSDINFPEQQYSIDFLLYIDYRDSSFGSKKIDFPNQLQFPDSKRILKIHVVDSTSYDSNGERNLIVEFGLIMSQDFDVIGYPFDDQNLKVEFSNPVFDTSKLNFITNNEKIQIKNTEKFENGWVPEVRHASKGCYTDDMHSVFYFNLPIHRKSAILIFSKLFIGMYIAFLVSFVALFIGLDHDEPRFGLPVGGLFAAIANKYIIESSLPLTSDFSLVDWLHTITIFAIFLIIAFSVISLNFQDIKDHSLSITKIGPFQMSGSWKEHFMNRVYAINPFNFLLLYILINIIVVLIAAFHESFGFG